MKTFFFTLLSIILVLGISYAAFDFKFFGDFNVLKSDQITLEFLKSNNVIDIENVFPVTDKVGMEQTESYDFQVKTTTKNDMSIKYSLSIEDLEVTDGYTRLSDDEVKVYLTDYEDNVLVEPTLISELDGTLYTKVNSHNVENEENANKYKIRVWVDYDVDASDWDENTKLEYKFTINVSTEHTTSYQVVFDSNNGTDKTVKQNIEYDKEERLDRNIFKKDGYLFMGWSLSKDGPVKYEDRELVTNLSGEEKSITLYAVWESAKPYTVIYNANGGVGTITSSSYNYNEEKALTKNTFTKEGYTFKGWATSKEGNVVYSDSEVVKNLVVSAETGKSITLYAVWQINKYEVEVLVNNGTASEAKKEAEHGSSLSFGVVPKDDNMVGEVSCSNNQIGVLNGNVLTVQNITNNTKCTVTYKYNTFTVLLNGNGATINGTTSITATYGESKIEPSTITLPKREYTVTLNANSSGVTLSQTSLKSTYTFNGWYSAQTSGTKVITSSATPAYEKSVTGYTDANGNWIKEGDAQLYAQWSSAKVSLPTVTKTGYTCKFNTKDDGSGTSYEGEAEITPSSNMTLYVVCTANTYTIEYNANNGSGTMSSSSHTYDVSKNLSKNTFTRTGYTFLGWNTNKDATSALYENEESVKNLTSVKDGKVTLYAIWKINSYTVSVTVNNGTVTPASKTINYNNTGTFTIGANTGYGSPTVSCTNSQTASISGTTLTTGKITNSAVCTVTYKENEYTITLNGNGATTNGTTSVKATYNSSSISPSSITVPVRKYTVSGFNANSTGANISSTSTLTSTYTFNGWYTEKTNGSKVLSNSATPTYTASVSGYTDANSKWVKAGTATLYAQWTSATVKLPTVTKTGYTCKWNTKDDGSGTSYESAATITPSANISALYAVCTAHTYTVEYYSYDGNTKYGSSSHTYDTAKALTAIGSLSNVTTPSGKTFYGWAESKDSTTRAYTDGKSVTNLTSTSGGTVKLYAIFQAAAKTYTATTQKNVSSATGSNTTAECTIPAVYNGTTQDTSCQITLPANPYTLTSWTFNGWVNGGSNTTTTTQSGTTATNKMSISGNVNIVATWKKTVAVTVTFDKNGGSANTTSAAVNTTLYNGSTSLNTSLTFTAPSATTRTGYTFVGYNTSSTATTSALAAGGTKSIAVKGTVAIGSTTYSQASGYYHIWTANTNTAYKVEHYVMNTSGSYPTTATSSENKTGKTDASLTLSNLKLTTSAYNVTNGIIYSHGTVGGSTVTTTTVAADGSRVIKLYYKRTYGTLTTAKGDNVSSVTTQSAVKYYYGATVPTLTATLSSATGYTTAFSKWTSSNTTYLANKTSNPTGTFTWPAMPEGTEITLTASATKTANTYKISYTLNGGTSGSSAPTSGTYDTAVTISNPTRTGYTFAGWTSTTINEDTAYQGSTAWSDGSVKTKATSFKNLTQTSGATVTLVANWTANTNTAYKVEHYVMNTSGSYPTTATSSENKTGTTAASLTLSNLKLTTSAYNVTNGILYSHGTVGGSTVTTTTIAADGSRVIKLYYKRTYGTLTTAKGDNISSVTAQNEVKYYYGATVPTLTATLSSATGYTITFSKWTSSNTTYLANKTSNPTGTFTWPAMPEGTEITLTASATKTANQYTITLNGNGATTNGTTSVKATYNSSSISPSSITVPVRKYTVSGFNANSTGANISSTSTLTSTYTFNGWYTQATGGSKVLSNTTTPTYTASISGYTDANSKWVKAGTATLYAQWTSATVKLPTVTKTGYTCKWNTLANGSGTTYNSGATITPSANIASLYAVCTVNQYTATFDANGGNTANPQTITKNYNVALGTLPTTSRSGYVFDGWYTAKTGGTKITTSTTMPTSNVTYYAQWLEIEAFAIYSNSDNSLRFYKNALPKESETTYNGLNKTEVYTDFEDIEFNAYSVNPWYAKRNDITKVVVEDEGIKPVSMARWFGFFENCSSFTLGKLDTSRATSMLELFNRAGYNATSFSITGLENFDTSNVTNMNYAFYYVGGNTTDWSIGSLSNWNTSKVERMYGMFQYAGHRAETFDIGNLETKVVTKTDGTKYVAWDMSNVSSIEAFFAYAGRYATTWNIGTISNWDTSKAISLKYLFYQSGCYDTTWSIGNLSTKSVTVNGKTYTAWDTKNVETMAYTFALVGSRSTEFNIGNIGNWNTTKVTDMRYMFDDSGINSSTWNVGDLSTKSVTINGTTYTAWNTAGVTLMTEMFSRAGRDASTFDIGNIGTWNVSGVTNMNNMFYGAGQNTTTWNIGNVKNWNTSNVTDMAEMFKYVRASELDLSGWNTLKVTSMTEMFKSIYYLEKLTLGANFNLLSDHGLDNPSKTYIPAAINGKWYNVATGQAYDGSAIPTKTAATYVVVQPSYKVIYNKNDSAATGTTATSTHYIGVKSALTDNGFSKTGYSFEKWNTKADGSGTSYSNKAEVLNLTTAGKEVTLYAQWIDPAPTCSITISEDGTLTEKTLTITSDATDLASNPYSWADTNLTSASRSAISNGTYTGYVKDVNGNVGSCSATILLVEPVNEPTLSENMIPVYYDEENNVWKKADSSNVDLDNKWYNYDKKMWANAVTVVEEKTISSGFYKEDGEMDARFRIIYEQNIVANTSYDTSETLEMTLENIYIVMPNESWTCEDILNKNYIEGSLQLSLKPTGNLFLNLYDTYGYVLFYTMIDGEYTLYYSEEVAGNEVATNLDVYKVEIDSCNIRNEYTNAAPGTVISMDYINTMLVWIPRYKYKVWNYNLDGTVTSKPQEIQITFEKGTVSTGEITCTDNIQGTSNGTASGTEPTVSEICKVNNTNCTDATCNNKTYTHPAFTFGNKELTGIWVGKFEVSSDVSCAPGRIGNEIGEGCNLTSIKPLVKPNVTPWTGAMIGTFENNMMAMNDNGNIYGFASTDDTHVVKNSEWGAVAYLSHSKYGINNEVASNTYYDENYLSKTGCGVQSQGSDSRGSICNAYNTSLGMVASTTGNIYGIYDMSGGSSDYVMGDIVSPDGSTMMSGGNYSSYVAHSGYDGILWDDSNSNYITYDGTYSYPDNKYIDKYSFTTNDSTKSISKLGDGIREVLNTSSNVWYDTFSYFPYNAMPWFCRGGGYLEDELSIGVFSSTNFSGGGLLSISSRLAISNE